MHAVTEAWHEGDSWYRKWSDGWVEQGGKTGPGQVVTITFHVPFAATDYFVGFTPGTSGNQANWNPGFNADRTTTGCVWNTNTPGCNAVLWTACGYAAD